jgi:hypothetical protein
MGLLSWFKRLFTSGGKPPSWRLPEQGLYVEYDDISIWTDAPDSEVGELEWADITSIFVQTSDAGPWFPDFWWCFGSSDKHKTLSFPDEAQGSDEIFTELQRRYPTLNDEAATQAIRSTRNATFLLWENKIS